VASARRAWPTLSKGFITTLHHHVMRLLSPECRARLVALPLQPLASATVAVKIDDRNDDDAVDNEDEVVSWHDAFMLKAGHTRRCRQALSTLERIPQGQKWKRSLAPRVEPGALEDWCCAVMLCCDRVIDRMLLLYNNHRWTHEYRDLFQQQTLMLATMTGARNVAQVRADLSQLNTHARTHAASHASLKLTQCCYDGDAGLSECRRLAEL
jgi:hypothetical protein